MTETNRELDNFLSDLRRPRKPGRFAVLRFALFVEYYPSEERALQRLRRLKQFERVGYVDRKTGITRCLKKYYHFLMAKLRSDGTAPEHFSRAGAIGHLSAQKRRRK